MDDEVKLCPFRKTVIYEDWDKNSEFAGDIYGYAYLPHTSSESFLPCLGEACAAYKRVDPEFECFNVNRCKLIGG